MKKYDQDDRYLLLAITDAEQYTSGISVFLMTNFAISRI
jgi:hypothetical protein